VRGLFNGGAVLHPSIVRGANHADMTVTPRLSRQPLNSIVPVLPLVDEGLKPPLRPKASPHILYNHHIPIVHQVAVFIRKQLLLVGGTDQDDRVTLLRLGLGGLANPQRLHPIRVQNQRRQPDPIPHGHHDGFGMAVGGARCKQASEQEQDKRVAQDKRMAQKKGMKGVFHRVIVRVLLPRFQVIQLIFKQNRTQRVLSLKGAV